MLCFFLLKLNFFKEFFQEHYQSDKSFAAYTQVNFEKGQQMTIDRSLKNKTFTLNLCFPMKGLFRETCKSQTINPFSPTHKFTLGIQIITKACQVCCYHTFI